MKITAIKDCPYCGREYTVELTAQKPGFRMEEDEICPYCGKVVRTSLEWEYTTYKNED